MTEETQILFEDARVRVVRHVSHGSATPKGQWYNQTEEEYAYVSRGEAVLRLEDGKEIRFPQAGVYRILPHVLHLVEYASPDCEWICLFIKN